MEMLMKQRELLDLGEELQGLRIVCQQGQCWITQAGDSRDHIMRRGDTFVIQARGRVIVTATEACRIQLATNHKTCNLQKSDRQAYKILKNYLATASHNAHYS